MNNFKGILLCSDLDGTLFNSDGKISDKNKEAIRYFTRNGGLFTLSTGRSPSYAKNIMEDGVDINTAIIALNGAMIYDYETDTVLYENPMNREKLYDFESFLMENKHLYEYIDFHSDKTYSRYSELSELPMYKAVFISKTPEQSALLRKNLENKYAESFFITNSWNIGLEIMDPNSTKGFCIDMMDKRIKDDVKTIVCAGDYENDIPMLIKADIGYAVANALDTVKKHADKITVSNNEDAIAAIIEDLKNM